jgi:alpha-glucosidase (family GH31 glycosyl hydrolase)
MNRTYGRREILKGATALCAGLLQKPRDVSDSPLLIAARDVELQIVPVSSHTFRLSILPLKNGTPEPIPMNGSLVQRSWAEPTAKIRTSQPDRTISVGALKLVISPDGLSVTLQTSQNDALQKLNVDKETGALSFLIPDAPLLGLGEGGPQFDRRGSKDTMKSGQGGYHLGTHGGRVPIPWLIGTNGWAIFFHQPFGTFDFTQKEGKFIPPSPEAALPLDIFFVASPEPATIMAEYATLTGHAEKPPLWSFGYQQSHRTLASHDEVILEAKTFREKKLPCDAMIYLGTGFCPSGWNSENGSFSWNARVFPEPKKAVEELHQEHFHVVLHDVILANKLSGTVHDVCTVSRFDGENAACYWDTHRKTFALGVDGWWPDEGDPLDLESRLTRNRMHWEGPQLDRPNERAYALHRNGAAGMQRYASFLWSGDVYSTWETLKTHIPIAINTGLSGIPYWGTDIGGFVPTKEFTAELYVRWFQFGAFCTLFRSHGRAWKLRLPWGWNMGETGPAEISGYNGSALPDASELHNADVEPICRKYLELRYRLLPYLYSAVHECGASGVPIMRALWLQYPGDPTAVARGDEYLWGRDILVAPVVDKGATSRKVYLPQGGWYDFWSSERLEGGREITRDVDLSTMPLFVREGAILPLGPVKQYVNERVDAPLTVTIYPGKNGSFLLYEDDGISFNHRNGEWMGIQMDWNDAQRSLKLRLANGSRMLGPKRRIEVKFLAGATRELFFEGAPLETRF